MLKITFEYRDKYNYPNWSKQTCKCESLKECKEFYGLGVDCEYHILSVEPIDK